MQSSHRKLLLLTAIGGALEFYDFTIYALFAPYISQLFFPNTQSFIGLINTFAVFALGYFARPLGGIVFGHLGDRWGRKFAFSFAILLMAVATLLIGCLPDFNSIGMAAPLLLILLRLLQGFSVGGEIPGASIFTLEHLSKKSHGLAIGLVFMSITLGNTLGAGVGFLLTSIFNESTMLSIGWRLAFIFGFFLGILGFVVRKQLVETPVFVEMMREKAIQRLPLFSAFQQARKKLVLGMLLTALTSSIVALFLYLPTYLKTIMNIQLHDAYRMNVIAFTLFALLTAFFGWVSDKINRKSLFYCGIFGFIILIYPLFLGLTYFGEDFIWVFIASIACFGAMINGSYMAMLFSLFSPSIRYTSVGISYGVGVAIFSGLAPLLFTYSIHLFNNVHAPAFYLILCGIFSFIAVSQSHADEIE